MSSEVVLEHFTENHFWSLQQFLADLTKSANSGSESAPASTPNVVRKFWKFWNHHFSPAYTLGFIYNDHRRSKIIHMRVKRSFIWFFDEIQFFFYCAIYIYIYNIYILYTVISIFWELLFEIGFAVSIEHFQKSQSEDTLLPRGNYMYITSWNWIKLVIQKISKPSLHFPEENAF